MLTVKQAIEYGRESLEDNDLVGFYHEMFKLLADGEKIDEYRLGEISKFLYDAGIDIFTLPRINGYTCYASNIGPEITIQEGVKEIGNCCFTGCDKLEKVFLPNSLEYIGDYCFKDSSLKEVWIGPNVKLIGDEAFDDGVTFHIQNNKYAEDWLYKNLKLFWSM